MLTEFLHCLCEEHFRMKWVAIMLNKVTPKVIPSGSLERVQAIELELFLLPGSPAIMSVNSGKSLNLPELWYRLL